MSDVREVSWGQIKVGVSLQIMKVWKEGECWVHMFDACRCAKLWSGMHSSKSLRDCRAQSRWRPTPNRSGRTLLLHAITYLSSDAVTFFSNHTLCIFFPFLLSVSFNLIPLNVIIIFYTTFLCVCVSWNLQSFPLFHLLPHSLFKQIW